MKIISKTLYLGAAISAVLGFAAGFLWAMSENSATTIETKAEVAVTFVQDASCEGNAGLSLFECENEFKEIRRSLSQALGSAFVASASASDIQAQSSIGRNQSGEEVLEIRFSRDQSETPLPDIVTVKLREFLAFEEFNLIDSVKVKKTEVETGITDWQIGAITALVSAFIYALGFSLVSGISANRQTLEKVPNQS